MPVNSLMSFTDTLAEVTPSSGNVCEGARLVGNVDACGPDRPTQ